jgi:Flp pilus assembly protein TadG
MFEDARSIEMKIPHRLRREEGAAAVEFALVAGLLFMLIFGMIEYGFAFFQMQDLRAATREGARVAAVDGNTTQIRTRVVQASAGSLPPGYSNITVAPSNGCATGGDSDNSVKVAIPTTNYASLPSNVVQSLTIDIPFLPQFQLHPTIEGSFRCEGS